MTYFNDVEDVEVCLVLTNKKQAKVLDRCERLGVPAIYFNRESFFKSDAISSLLTAMNIDLVVLAGFLWKVPEGLLRAFPGKIVNIHPALLPKYGGKGMYGAKVHEAVKAAGEIETGITIHEVNENYDEGAIIFQAKVSVDDSDSPDSIASKVHELEYEHYPRVIHELLTHG